MHVPASFQTRAYIASKIAVDETDTRDRRSIARSPPTSLKSQTTGKQTTISQLLRGHRYFRPAYPCHLGYCRNLLAFYRTLGMA